METALLWERTGFPIDRRPHHISIFGDDEGHAFRWIHGEDVGPFLPPTLKVVYVSKDRYAVELPVWEEPVARTYDPDGSWWEDLVLKREVIVLRQFAALTDAWDDTRCYRSLYCGWAPQAKKWVLGRSTRKCHRDWFRMTQ